MLELGKRGLVLHAYPLQCSFTLHVLEPEVRIGLGETAGIYQQREQKKDCGLAKHTNFSPW
jgi:hypothetical protein